MKISRLLDYGFTLNEENPYFRNYSLLAGGLRISVSVGEGIYCTPRALCEEYEEVEIAFLRQGEFIRPVGLPLDFPLSYDQVFAYVPVAHLCSLLPLYAPNFEYKAGMRVRDYEGCEYTLRGNPAPSSTKLDALTPNGNFRVLDKADITLIGF